MTLILSGNKFRKSSPVEAINSENWTQQMWNTELTNDVIGYYNKAQHSIHEITIDWYTENDYKLKSNSKILHNAHPSMNQITPQS